MGSETGPGTGSETPPGTNPPQSSEMDANNNTAPPAGSETPPTETTPPTSPEEMQAQLEKLQAALKKANGEAATYRHKARELDDLQKKLADEKLSTQEKLEKQLAELQSAHEALQREHQESTVNYAVQLRAAALGMAHPDKASRLIDWSSIEYDDLGRPTNIDDLLRGLLKEMPELAAGNKSSPPPSSGGATNPSRSSANRQPLSWNSIAQMSRQEYDQRRAEIVEWMQNNPVRR